MSPRKRKGVTLTLQFLPYADLAGLPSPDRVEKLLKIVKENKIILMEGRLKATEEAELIRRTMEEVDDRFKGIEIETLDVKSGDQAFLQKIRSVFINFILGDRQGLTIIGPATVVKEIKKDPDKIQLLAEDSTKRRKR